MIRTKGEPGTGDVVHAVQHMRTDRPRDQGPHRPRRRRALQRRQGPRRPLRTRPHGRQGRQAARPQLLRRRHRHARRRRPHDAARRRNRLRRLRHLHEGARHPARRREQSRSSAKRPSPAPRPSSLATTHFNDPKIVAEASEAVIGSMKGLAAAAIEEQHLMQTRGW